LEALVERLLKKPSFSWDAEEILLSANISPPLKRAVLLIVLLCLASACAAPADTPTAIPVPQQLRIVNSGNQDITGLIVLFPGPTADAEATRVEFGDVPAGKTTEYRSVPGGVYRYAAYEYTLDSRLVNQAVVDWVGERPMEGGKFTYRVALDPKKVPGSQIELIEVLVDAP
jgi:hypothetical protein